MRAEARLCAVAALGVLLAACAGLPATPSETPPVFTLQGRVVIKGRDTAFSSGLRWQAGPDEDELWLNAPLGQTLGYLKRDGGGAALTTADQTVYRAGSIESLTRRAFGWELPADGLRWWVLGRAAPASAATDSTRDARDRLTSLVQDGWRVKLEYDGESPQPLRLQATKPDAELRLVIDGLELTRSVP